LHRIPDEKVLNPLFLQERGRGIANKISLTIKQRTIMEEKNNLTAERSLEIIRESIERSQRTITKNASLPMIWWGVCVVAFALLISYLWKNHGGPFWNILWAVMWVVGYAGNWLIDKKKESVPTTFVGKTIGHVWATFGVFCGGIGIFLGLIGNKILPLELILPNVYVFGSITSIISLCFGMGTTITGLIVKSRIIQICGLIAGIGGFFYALHFPDHRQLLVMAGVAAIGLIVPGFIIHLQNKK